VRVFAYSLVPRPDAVTAHFQNLADAWRDVSGLDAAAIAALARVDGLQVLVDLAGHTGGNRIEVFAHRAAPVQVTWLGYPATTGLSRMQGRIVDAWTDPPGAEAHGTEPLLRLPGCFLCYGPPADAPDPATPRCLDSGTVAFGSFNALPKLNDRVIALWSRILREVPQSRLRLKAAGLEEPETRGRLQARFADAGLDDHRLDLSGWEPGPAQHLARYLAVDQARNSVRLSYCRATFRARVAASGLCDAGAFARGMEALYSPLWEGWTFSP
jgi:predicted O-linked N-acetylglucosamine transferase (SPINDLY family)